MPTSTINTIMEDNNSGGGAKKKARIVSEQEKKQLQGVATKQRDSVDHCVHVLKTLTNNPIFWGRPEFKEVRECLAVIRCHPENFPHVLGDQLPDNTTLSSGNQQKRPESTTNYISLIAE